MSILSLISLEGSSTPSCSINLMREGEMIAENEVVLNDFGL